MDRLRHRTSLRGGDTAHKNMFRCSRSYLESKTETSVVKAQDYIWGGDTRHGKSGKTTSAKLYIYILE